MKTKIILLSALFMGLVLFLPKFARIDHGSATSTLPDLVQSTAVSNQDLGNGTTNMKPNLPATGITEQEKIESLDLEAVEANIAAIDQRLEAEGWVERANTGHLSETERAQFLRLLELRNRYFARKIELI